MSQRRLSCSRRAFFEDLSLEALQPACQIVVSPVLREFVKIADSAEKFTELPLIAGGTANHSMDANGQSPHRRRQRRGVGMLARLAKHETHSQGFIPCFAPSHSRAGNDTVLFYPIDGLGPTSVRTMRACVLVSQRVMRFLGSAGREVARTRYRPRLCDPKIRGRRGGGRVI